MAAKKKVAKKKVAKKAVKKKKPAPTKFYAFRQNNSFGRFDYDQKRGISVNVIVEADSIDDANSRAERIGLYFNGGGDCPCCGNRWSEQYAYSGKDDSSTPFPAVYSEKIEPGERYQKGNRDAPTKWMSDKQPDGYIHYKDGTIASFW